MNANHVGPTREEWDDHLNLVRHLEKRIDTHDQEVREFVTGLVKNIVEGMPKAFKSAIVEATWEIIDDEKFRAKLSRTIIEDGQKAIKQSVGGFFLSRWFTIGAIVVLVASYVGWPATFKMVASLFGRQPPAGD